MVQAVTVGLTCSTSCTTGENRGNVLNCVHWLYAVGTGTATSTVSSTCCFGSGRRRVTPSLSGRIPGVFGTACRESCARAIVASPPVQGSGLVHPPPSRVSGLLSRFPHCGLRVVRMRLHPVRAPASGSGGRRRFVYGRDWPGGAPHG